MGEGEERSWSGGRLRWSRVSQLVVDEEEDRFASTYMQNIDKKQNPSEDQKEKGLALKHDQRRQTTSGKSRGV
jgi:hypothetical protein